jgi:hypothetical protein
MVTHGEFDVSEALHPPVRPEAVGPDGHWLALSAWIALALSKALATTAPRHRLNYV